VMTRNDFILFLCRIVSNKTIVDIVMLKAHDQIVGNEWFVVRCCKKQHKRGGAFLFRSFLLIEKEIFLK
jgi:hypothetical protein